MALTAVMTKSRITLKSSARCRMRLSAIGTFAAMLVAVCVLRSQSSQVGSASTPEGGPKPLMLEKNEGEQRIWRDPPPGGFVLKVSPKNNGSQHLVLGTEDFLPG